MDRFHCTIIVRLHLPKKLLCEQVACVVGLMCSEAAVPPPTPLVPDSANHYADHQPIRLAPLVAMVTTSCFIVMFPHVHVQREREREREREMC